MSAALDVPAAPPSVEPHHGSTAPSGFVPRGAAVQQLHADIKATRRIERDRRLRHLVTVGGGWFMAGVMGLVATGALALVWNRPAPKDRLAIAFARDDGSYEPPTLREDLPATRRDVLFRYTVIQHVYARENYTWEGVNANYRQVSATTTPEERARYQAIMLDPKNKENPAVRFGTGPGATTANVEAIKVVSDRSAPNAVAAQFILRVRPPHGPPRDERHTARMTWMDAADKIPLAVQQQHAPAGIAFSHYESIIDPEGSK